MFVLDNAAPHPSLPPRRGKEKRSSNQRERQHDAAPTTDRPSEQLENVQNTLFTQNFSLKDGIIKVFRAKPSHMVQRTALYSP